MIALKTIASLTEKKDRDRLGLFLAEGPDVAECLLRSAYPLEGLLVEETHAEKFNGLIRFAEGLKVPVHLLLRAAFQKISGTEATQGVAALARIRKDTLPDRGPIVYLDCVQNPGNVGAVVRTAAAAGFSAVIAGKGCADFFNPKVVRGSAGAIGAVACVEDRGGGLLSRIREKGWPVVVTDCAKGKDFRTFSYKRDMALVMGNEGEGVSAPYAAQADDWIHIPMKGEMKSLNIAVAFGIIAFAMRIK